MMMMIQCAVMPALTIIFVADTDYNVDGDRRCRLIQVDRGYMNQV